METTDKHRYYTLTILIILLQKKENYVPVNVVMYIINYSCTIRHSPRDKCIYSQPTNTDTMRNASQNAHTYKYNDNQLVY